MTVGLSTTDEEFIDRVFSLVVGDSFKYDDTTDYETIFKRIVGLKPRKFKTFDVMYAQPGTSYFTGNGPNTVVVIKIELALG